jgi:metal-dependent amidase/aminoacylase/carboxypeptidase family protein
MLGLLRDGETQMPSLHQPDFDFNDEVIATGIKMFCELAVRYSGS